MEREAGAVSGDGTCCYSAGPRCEARLSRRPRRCEVIMGNREGDGGRERDRDKYISAFRENGCSNEFGPRKSGKEGKNLADKK